MQCSDGVKHSAWATASHHQALHCITTTRTHDDQDGWSPMPSRVPQTRTDDRDETAQDDFEERMAGVSRLPGRRRLVEEAVVGARHGAAVRERPAPGERGGKAGSTGRGPRIEVGSVAGLNRRQADALRGGGIAIDGRLDLHGLTRREAGGKVAAFLARSARHGHRCVLVITGQGRRDPLAEARGVLRGGLAGWLNKPATRPLVLACVHAQPRHGGQGAFYVLLRRSRSAGYHDQSSTVRPPPREPRR